MTDSLEQVQRAFASYIVEREPGNLLADLKEQLERNRALAGAKPSARASDGIE